jgi:hypothetical protein
MNGRKSLLNYTTTIPVQTTAGEISQLLAQAKANAIMTEYDDGTLTALSFRIRTEFGVLTFRLPAQVETVFLILHRSRTIPLKFRTREQAARIAWRIIKDWLEAQLAMIQAGLVKIEQVFLPYAQDPKTGRTVYEALCDNRFSGYLLPNGKA